MPRNLIWRSITSLNWITRRGGRFLLSLLRFPGFVQVVCFALLLHYAEKTWYNKFGGVWEPGFPKAWTLWVLFLAVVPIFALLQLTWLLGSWFLLWFINKRFGRRFGYAGGIGNGNGRQVFAHDEEYMLLQEVEREQGPQSIEPPTTRIHHKVTSRIPALRTTLWWTQVVIYISIIIVGYREYVYFENADDIRFRPALQKALSHRDRDPTGYGKGERIYFAAAFYNNQEILPYWTKTLLDVIAYLGTDNVFVSVVENNSDDKTPELLRDLDEALARRNVQRRILVQDAGVPRPPDMAWNNRIEFLAAIRNRALEPLIERGGYDKVVFSNDIYIEPESLIELIETADGNYDMACAMDFGHFGAYDMWVLRDRLGHLTAGIWPYFFDAADYEAVKSGSPVPVFTCWNGIVAFQADPVLPVHLRSNRTLSTSPLRRPPPPTHPLSNSLGDSPAVTPPLVFRASPRGEGCYSSESYLLPYDMRRIMGMERIYVNPRVITAYVWHFYVWHKWVLRHRLVRWFVEDVYNGAWMQYARMIVGDDDKVYTWDGGDCHPWWYGDWW